MSEETNRATPLHNLNTSALAALLGCRRQAIIALCKEGLPHKTIRTYKNRTQARAFNLEEVRSFLAGHPDLKIGRSRAVHTDPSPGSDGEKLLNYLTASDRWIRQPAGLSATRSFLAHAGERKEQWTEEVILAWEDTLASRLKPSTVLLYVMLLERVLRDAKEAGVMEAQVSPVSPGISSATAQPDELTASDQQAIDAHLQCPPPPGKKLCEAWQCLTELEDARNASETEESLLDELFLTFGEKPFTWTVVYQATRANPALTIALEDVGLPRDRQQWGYMFNSLLKTLQGKKFSSRLCIVANEVFKEFRPMSWGIVQEAVEPNPPVEPVMSKVITQIGKESIRKLVSEGIIGNVLTGKVADQILSLASDTDSAMTVFGKAYAAGMLNGEQLDWLLTREKETRFG